MTQNDDHLAKNVEKPNVCNVDGAGKKEREGVHSSGDAIDKAPKSLLDTVADPDIDSDPAAEIEEKGEPFEGNHA